MKRVCVYCGSSPGNEPVYLEAARNLGRILANNGMELVYGGAGIGLMGAVADSVLDNGGRAIGVIPELLNDKVAHPNLTELHVTRNMHERKTLMFDLSDAFIALPGGLGTLEELFEVMTWAQLGSHEKPCGLLNVSGYYNQLLDFLNHTSTQGFVLPDHLTILSHNSDPEKLLAMFREYKAPVESKIDKLSLLERKN